MYADLCALYSVIILLESGRQWSGVMTGKLQRSDEKRCIALMIGWLSPTDVNSGHGKRLVEFVL